MPDTTTERGQFLFRLMGLKQRVIFDSQQAVVECSYAGGFYRVPLKGTLVHGPQSWTRSMTEEEGRLKRLGAVSKSPPVTKCCPT